MSALHDRVVTMLATYERRGNTNVPGTVTLLRDLDTALQDAEDRADKAEARVRRLLAGPRASNR